MTAEEAIKNMCEALNEGSREQSVYVFFLRLAQTYEKCGYKGLASIYTFAADALEKQIPKKAVDVKRFQTGLQGKCPVCGGRLLRMKYCQGCGQRIDWSED